MPVLVARLVDAMAARHRVQLLDVYDFSTPRGPTRVAVRPITPFDMGLAWHQSHSQGSVVIHDSSHASLPSASTVRTLRTGSVTTEASRVEDVAGRAVEGGGGRREYAAGVTFFSSAPTGRIDPASSSVTP